ncbi:MAG TPA: AMP-binding protein [Alphaproteobacteria bacterium]|nr:AMP-binding protein [Alphaproteobacteria bacterium]
MDSPFIAMLDHHPELPALHIGDFSATRAQLKAQSHRLAGHLARAGFKRGDVLALWLPDGAAWLQFLFAASALGLLIVPVSTRYRALEARHAMEVARAKGLVVATRFLDIDFPSMAREIGESLPQPAQIIEVRNPGEFVPAESQGAEAAMTGRPSDPLCTFSTSGTTGRPKLAVHDQASIARHAANVARRIEIGAGDAMLCALPLYGVLGFVQAFAALAAGAACVLEPVFKAEAAAAAIERHRVTHFYGSDGMLEAVLNVKGHSLATWRRGGFAEYAGLGAALVERTETALGLRLTGVYGSSEGFALLATQMAGDPLEKRALAGGRPVSPDIQFRVVDPDSGRPVADGTPGELQLRGYNVMSGYLNNPIATAEAFTADGWFRTGDLAYGRGADFVFLSRMKDSLRLRGYLVDPGEIEAFLMRHAAVEGAQVVGVNRRGEGDIAVAFVRRNDARLSEEALIAYCRGGIASYKVPRRIVFVEDFPRINGPNGSKIVKHELRARAESLIPDAGNISRAP